MIGFRVPFSKPLITKSTAVFWRAGLPLVSQMLCPLIRAKPLRLDGDHSAINHQLSASDKTAVIGGQEDHSLGDLIGLTHPPERDLCRHLRSVLRDLLFVAQALISLSWHHTGADGVDANFTLLQIAGPGAGKGTNRCFRRAVNAEGFHAHRGDDRGIQDNGAPILQQGKRFLDGKKQSFNVDVKDLIEMFLRDLAQWSKTSATGVRENNIQVSFLLSDSRVKPI